MQNKRSIFLTLNITLGNALTFAKMNAISPFFQNYLSSVFLLNEPGEVQLLINTSPHADAVPNTWLKLYYIQDLEGKPRWLFPKRLRFSHLLHLENEQASLSSVWPGSKRFLARLGLAKTLAQGYVYVRAFSQTPLGKFCGTVPHDQFAIFLHDDWENSKAVICLCQGKLSSHYIKVALSGGGTDAIYNEIYALQILGQRTLRNMIHPFLNHTYGDHAILLSGVKSLQGKRLWHLTEVHFRAITEWNEVFLHEKLLEEALELQALPDNLDLIYQDTLDVHHLLSNYRTDIQFLIEYLYKYVEKLSAGKKILVALSHGDFSPWNIYVNRQQLSVYDWEKTRESLPLFYDLFHFIYQADTYGHLAPPIFNRRMQEIMLHPILKAFCDKYTIDWMDYHHYFLVRHVADRLTSWRQASQVPPGIQSLLNIWRGWLENGYS